MTSQSQPVQPGVQGSVAIVGSHYQVGKKIGEGSFGVVFEGTNLLNGLIIAIKFEPRKSDAPQLRDEYRSYRILQGCPGIPQAYYYGTEGLHNVLCIDLLGPNLEDLFDLCGRRFSTKTVAMLAKQMIERVQSIHEKNLIYRDIKPDNFLIGLPGTRSSDMIYMVDFGMAKLWRDPRTRQHIPYRERKSLSGTARYMSINTHLGREQSRRDDLEGLGHVFMYFLRGSLPWQGLKAANNKQKYERIGERKQSVPIAELADGFPEEFNIYLNYVRKLGFEETPDYEFLKELFAKVLRSAGDSDDSSYDWKLLNSGKGWEANAKLPSNLLPQLAHHGTVHRTRDASSPANPNARQHRTSALQSSTGMSPSAPPAAAVARNNTQNKTRKHSSSMQPMVAYPTNSGTGTPGSNGLIVGSARASRAMSPLQTTTQGSGGGNGSPMLTMSTTPAGAPHGGMQHRNSQSASPHPYAAAVHSGAPQNGQWRPNTMYQQPSATGSGVGANGAIMQQPQRNSMVPGGSLHHQASMNYGGGGGSNARPNANGNGVGGSYGSSPQQQGVPMARPGEERDLPAPPPSKPKLSFGDILRCRCG